MSSANVYRFFGSKLELIEAIADRMLGAKEARSREIARLPLPASERLRMMIHAGHQNTVETMIGETKVHEMVVVAMDEQWGIIQAHIARMTNVIAAVIEEGMAAGEFRQGDAHLAARCFHQAIIALVHPQLVFQCGRDKTNYVSVDPMVDFALIALKA
jgi:AcrR family transcriptional regulator